jgi:Baseplate J-like protein
MAITTPGFDFASRDYENIRRDILARAEGVLPEWTDRDVGDFTMLLVDLWAYMGDIMHYYVDRAAGEAFIDTASQKESVLALASLFDYVPKTRSAARATVYVSNGSAASVTLPKGTVFIAEGEITDYEFFSTSEVTIAPGMQAGVICNEGNRYLDQTLVSNATGQIGQVYKIRNLDVIPSSVEVYVYEDYQSPSKWTRFANINLIPIGSSGFSTYVDTEGATNVVFGNRVSGRVPPPGVRIAVNYNTTNGASGNVGSNKIKSFKNSQPVGVAISSSTTATGGSSGESIDSIKRAIKSTIKTQSRAVTLSDYVALALQMPGVYKAVASYTPGATGGSVSVKTIPYISEYYDYTSNTITIDTDTADNLVTNLQRLSMLGITVSSSTTVTARPRTISGTIHVTDGYVASEVLDSVKTIIDNIFSIENIEFGKDIRIGDLYRTIHSLEGVDYAEFTVTGSAVANDEVIRLNKSGMNIVTSGGITAVV